MATAQRTSSVPQDIRLWRDQAVRIMLRVTLVVGALALGIGVYDAVQQQRLWITPLYAIAYASAVLVALLRRTSTAVRAASLLAIAYALALGDFISAGLGGDAVPYMVALPFMAVLFYGRREGIAAIGLVAVTMGAFATLFCSGILPAPAGTETLTADPARWGSAMAAVLMLSVLLVISQSALLQRLGNALVQSRQLADEVQSQAAVEEERHTRLQAAVASYNALIARVAEGDLSARLSLDAGEEHDPLVTLGQNLDGMIDSLHGMTARVKSAAASLGAAATRILGATTQQAAGADQQSAAIAQTSSTINQVRVIAEQTAQRAAGVAQLAEETTEVSAAGQQAVSESIAGVAAVKERVERIAGDITALSAQAQAIGTLIATVNAIAVRSNLLALNAAVEAARAGEVGRGFAVVAQEVRALAEQSRAATEQVRDILSEIERGMDAAAVTTQEGENDADVGMRLAGEAGQSIRRLGERVVASTQAAQQIAAAAGQQQAGMEQIALAMGHIQEVTAQNLAGSRQVEQAAGELHTLAQQLEQLVEQYQL
jgi:methyl-accepting chemotaxis protein